MGMIKGLRLIINRNTCSIGGFNAISMPPFCRESFDGSIVHQKTSVFFSPKSGPLKVCLHCFILIITNFYVSELSVRILPTNI